MPRSEFQKQLFHVLKRRLCHCQYFATNCVCNFPHHGCSFQPIFLSFVAISSVLCPCFKAVSVDVI